MKTPGRDDAPFVVRLDGPDGEEDSPRPGGHRRLGHLVPAEPARRGRHPGPRRGRAGRADRLRHPRRPRRRARAGTPAGGSWWSAAATPPSTPWSTSSPWPARRRGTEITWAVRRPTLGAGVRRRRTGRPGRAGPARRAGPGAGRDRSGPAPDRGSHRPARPRTADGCRRPLRRRAASPRSTRSSAATGFRPDLSIVSELRLSVDPALESPTVARPAHRPQRP